ncbi:MAG: VacB/RNase II family 3'-5' exoribonuclease [Pseudomonadales bacterium]
MLDPNALGALKQLKKDIRDSRNIKTGRVRSTRSNFGFIDCDDESQVFLPPDEMVKVFPGDTVEVEVFEDKQGRAFAKIQKLTSSELKSFYGFCVSRGNALFVESESVTIPRWLFIPPKERKKAQAGDRVEARVLRHPLQNDGKGQARITRIIGKPDDAEIESLYARNMFSLDREWPTEIDAELDILRTRFEQELGERPDLSDIPFVTIDAPSTKDMDDALFAKPLADGWLLQVAIADPSALIQADSPLDKLARQRASSVYFPHGATPMLPDGLSCDLLSLMPNEKRLAVVVSIHINTQGDVIEVNFELASITSIAKLSYRDVSQFLLEGKNDIIPDVAQESLRNLQQIANSYSDWRSRNQLLGDDRTDYRLILDDKGKVETIIPQLKTPAHAVVEACMLMTNQAVANTLSEAECESIYIAHTGIRAERLAEASTLLKRHAELDFSAQSLASLEGYIDLQRKLKGHSGDMPVAEILKRMMVRSVLSPTPADHKGLGAPAYLTFTSPIRRYQDLVVHRQLKALLNKQDPDYILSSDQLIQLQAQLDRIRQATNYANNWLRCQYAQTLKDQVLSGTLVQVSPRGLGVRLDDTGIEGLVEIRHLAKLHFDSLTLSLNNDQQRFVLNQAVKVKIQAVDADRQKITMSLCNEEE